MAWTAKGSDWVLGFGRGARSESRVFAAKASELDSGDVKWIELFKYEDSVSTFWLKGDDLYFKTTKGAPNGAIKKVSLTDAGYSNISLLLDEQEGIITNYSVDDENLYYSIDFGGKSSLFSKSLSDGTTKEIQTPFIGRVVMSGYIDGDSPFYFYLQGWTQPRKYFSFNAKRGEIQDLDLQSKTNTDLSDIVVERLEAPSHDGVMVPYTVVYKKGLNENGQNPTVVWAYGGYGFTMNPLFLGTRKAWLERGGILVYAHIRGSGAKGKNWHRAGQGVNKKNGVRDVVAVTQNLIDQNYTSSNNVALVGASMGGVIAGRASTEEPELFKATALLVGLLNPLRYLESDNGANQTAELTATPDTKEGFDILYSMDSYHNIKAGTKYPDTMIVVGLNDQRVEPWESGKYAARMQAIAAPETVTFLRASDGEGHGVGSSKNQYFMQRADIWSFFLQSFESDGEWGLKENEE